MLLLGGLRTKRFPSWCAAAALVLSASVGAAADPMSVPIATVEMVSTSDPLVFDGRVQALRYAEVSNRINGVVSSVDFFAGRTVEAGQLLLELAPETYETAVLAASANLDRAEA